MKFPKLMSLVEVEWVDSTVFHSSWASFESWQDRLAETPDGLICTSVGYLLRVDKQRIVIAQSFNSFNHVSDSISIPVGCIKSTKVMGPPKKMFA